MKRLPGLPDEELLRLFAGGNPRAFDVLFLRYQPDIQRVVGHYIKDRALAEDLAQDTFLKIYTSLQQGRYNEEGRFMPWALRIAHNLCMDHLRKTRHLPVFSANATSAYNATADTADGKMVSREQQRKLHLLISRLPDAQKKLVWYRYFEELSFREISVLMNTNMNTSLGRMRYALSNLRKQVQHHPPFIWH